MRLIALTQVEAGGDAGDTHVSLHHLAVDAYPFLA
jgi:hypothetical protein